MKLHLYTIIMFCSILLMSCGEETPKKTEASAEHTAIKMPAEKKQNQKASTENGEVIKDNTTAANDVESSNDNDNRPTQIRGSQNFDPNSDETYYDGNTDKGVKQNTDNTSNVNVDPRKGGVPQMVFKEEIYNFGTVEEGENVSVVFELTNTGTGDLVISNAKGSCGCTEPSFSFLPIGPNEKSTIDVTFKTAGREGSQRKAVTITSNAYPKIRKIYLEGKVVPKGELNKDN